MPKLNMSVTCAKSRVQDTQRGMQGVQGTGDKRATLNYSTVDRVILKRVLVRRLYSSRDIPVVIGKGDH